MEIANNVANSMNFDIILWSYQFCKSNRFVSFISKELTTNFRIKFFEAVLL